MKLSILCLTYNHQNFIKQTLDSFLMQRTNFPFEVIIHDDASTDNTANIIREYEKKYPNIIKPIYQKDNKWSKGVNIDKEYNFLRISGEYVALCEGDDYWTDENKLQKQVDFLEKNKDYTICFHPVAVVDENGIFKNKYPDEFFIKKNKNLNFKKLLKTNFIQTNSVVYRWIFNKEDIKNLPDNIMPADWFLHLSHAYKGKIGFINETMSAYRKHSGGVWHDAGVSDSWFLKYGFKNLGFYEEIIKRFNAPKQKAMRKMFRQTLNCAIKNNNVELIEKIKERYPKLYKKQSKKSFLGNLFIRFRLLKYNVLSLLCKDNSRYKNKIVELERTYG